MSDEMKPKKFIASVPPTIEERLREEARRADRSRNAQLVQILKERYGLVESAELQPAA